MSDEDIEARVEKLWDVVFCEIKKAIESGAIKSSPSLLVPNGMELLKNNLRVLIPIIDQSPHGAWGRVALVNVIVGGVMFGSGAIYTDDTKRLILRQPASKGGKESGKNRRAENEEGWRPRAFSLACKIRDEDKGITQAKLALKIKDRWKLMIPCPESQLIHAISQWEKEGKLPRRNTG